MVREPRTLMEIGPLHLRLFYDPMAIELSWLKNGRYTGLLFAWLERLYQVGIGGWLSPIAYVDFGKLGIWMCGSGVRLLPPRVEFGRWVPNFAFVIDPFTRMGCRLQFYLRLGRNRWVVEGGKFKRWN